MGEIYYQCLEKNEYRHFMFSKAKYSIYFFTYKLYIPKHLIEYVQNFVKILKH
jgi:hypothetical protein